MLSVALCASDYYEVLFVLFKIDAGVVAVPHRFVNVPSASLQRSNSVEASSRRCSCNSTTNIKVTTIKVVCVLVTRKQLGKTLTISHHQPLHSFRM